MKGHKPISDRGIKLETRMRAAIEKLEKIGFAHDIKVQDQVKDRDGNIRKVDLSFILCTCLVDILVTVECKSRERTLTLHEVDQLKVLKTELPGRNIFWLVVDGEVSETVRTALKSAGIIHYSIDGLEQIIESICNQYKGSEIPRLRAQASQLSVMCFGAFWQTVNKIEDAERKLIKQLGITPELLAQGIERSSVRLRPCEDYWPNNSMDTDEK